MTASLTLSDSVGTCARHDVRGGARHASVAASYNPAPGLSIAIGIGTGRRPHRCSLVAPLAPLPERSAQRLPTGPRALL